MSKIDNFSYPTPIPTKIWGCSLWSRSAVFGSADREMVMLISRVIIFAEFQFIWLWSQITIPQRHRRTDGRTTCHGNTALRVASRGKNGNKKHAYFHKSWGRLRGERLSYVSMYLLSLPIIFSKILSHATLARLRFILHFYRAMHFSAYARSWDRMSSVCLSVRLSVRLSVTLVDCDHISWKSWKLIARTISPGPSLFVAKRRSTYSQGNMGKFGGD